MALRNSYTDLIERLCFEVIPDYSPPVQVTLTGRYEVTSEVTLAVTKVPANAEVKFTFDFGGSNDG